ncbi:MAG: hypothetical protein ACE3JK_01905 [Sporolactobacillus sp.]
MRCRKWCVSLIVFTFILSSLSNVSSAKTISMHAGIGDTKSAFNKAYGKGKGDSEMMSYKHNYILPMFLDKAAYNILLQFESTSSSRRSKKNAIKAYKYMIPTDSKKVKQYYDNGGERLIIIYQSNRLAKSVKKAVFLGDKPGSFMAILHRDHKGYFSVTLATGNSNP